MTARRARRPAPRSPFRVVSSVEETAVVGSVAERVRLARAGLRMTQRELGARAKVSPGTVSRLERGLNFRSGGWLTVVCRVLRALGLSLVVRG